MRSKGVSANSRIIPHRYPDEFDGRGRFFRRLIRRREDAFWRRELARERFNDSEAP